MVFDFMLSPNTLSDLTNFAHTIRPGGEQGRGPLTVEFLQNFEGEKKIVDLSLLSSIISSMLNMLN